MRVADILSVKGGSVVTIEDGSSLNAAAQLLDSHGIGALVVMDPAGNPVAVLTERDIVREIALHGRACLPRSVAHATTPSFVTANPEESVDEVMQRMTERRVRHLPVLDQARRLIGIVSIGDAVKAKIADAEAQTAAMRQYILS